MAFTICSLLSFVFVFIAQAVLTHAKLTFQFTSGVVRQCEPVSITFDGLSKDDAQRPSSLSVLPLGYPPVVFPLSRVTGTNPSDSILLTSLPFPAGTSFLATLEDTQGRGLSAVSELMTIQPSTAGNNSTCLPTSSSPARTFRLQENPSQCQEFTVQYNSTAVRETPRVTVYAPQGISLRLNSTSTDQSAGASKYLMSLSREKHVILLIDGGNGIRETTSFITVSGDAASSPSDCLQAERDAEIALFTRETRVVSSKTIIIGAAAGGGAVVLIALAMTFFILHDRRKRRLRRLQTLSFDGSRMVKSPLSPLEKAPLPRSPPAPGAPGNVPPPPSSSYSQPGPVVDPTYTAGKKTWSWVIPEESEWKHPGIRGPSGHRPGRPSIAHSETRNVAPTDYAPSDRLSINSLDIEGMLNMAAVQSAETRSRKSSVPMVMFGGSQENIGATPAAAAGGGQANSSTTGSPPARRELKVNSDIPAGALSATTSFYDSYMDTSGDVRSSSNTQNPFMPEESVVIQAGRRYQGPNSPLRMTGPSQGRTPGGSLGLPTSPRSVRLAPGRASIGGSSRRSSTDWYGIGIAR